ncbi:hypothetical protein NLI96_g5228 [Meripilus lineatus]|uniref:Cytochrome P450 n=1 Tax=Meripilus lineatus TaxID=2056292 RepID=A0AAD5V3D1_9APHY|nr:hypothetical protein NLI96_g5228 [Physisporinus lineatus]
MLDNLRILDSIFAALGIYLISAILWSKHCPANGSLPPGPKRLPLIGNVLDMPTSKEWLTFEQWGKQWGGVVSVVLMGQPLVILNSAKAAIDLLEKRSAIYSDRPTVVMGGEIVGWNRTLVLTRYGDRFREFRRYMFRLMGGNAQVKDHHHLIHVETHRFLQRLLHTPEAVAAHIRKTAGSIILMMSHGYTVQEEEDPIVNLVDVATEQFSEATRPGAFLVDVLPVLRYVPSWFPGAGFQKIAVSWSKTANDMADIPHDFVKQQMRMGTDISNYTSRLLDTDKLTSDKEFNIKWSAASLYAGGADTTVSAIYSFFLAMTLYPEVQRKAQEEIDIVVGNDRLPTFEDRGNLPYVEALVKEVFRFKPVAPLGVPHRLMQDDEYDGYYLPKGTLLIANIWRMLKDPEVYKNPFDFDPTRFIASENKPSECDPRDICFGFGRRVCPGLSLANASVYLSCVMTLAVYNVTKCVEDGKIIEPVDESTDGTISHPKPFKCSIVPRSSKAEALIRSISGPDRT